MTVEQQSEAASEPQTATIEPSTDDRSTEIHEKPSSENEHDSNEGDEVPEWLFEANVSKAKARKAGRLGSRRLSLHLPKWFLERNVSLLEELRERRSLLKIRPLSDDSNEEPTEVPTKVPTAVQTRPPLVEVVDVSKPKGTAIYKLEQGTYNEVLDVVSSGFCPIAQTNPASTVPSDMSFMVHSSHAGSLEFLDVVVARLALDMEADLLSLDAQDLEDIFQHFWLGLDENLRPSRNMAGSYIDAYCTGQPSKAWIPPDALTNLVLGGCHTKRKSQDQESRQDTGQKPVVVHLRNIEGYRHLARLDDIYGTVKRKHLRGQPIVIITTTRTVVRTSGSSVPPPPGYLLLSVNTVWLTLDLSTSTVMTISPRCTFRALNALEKNQKSQAARGVWREFLRTLRAEFGTDIVSDVLGLSPNWPLTPDGSEEIVSEWDESTASRVARQIRVGFRRLPSSFNSSDAYQIILRASANKQILSRSNREGDDSSGLEADSERDASSSSSGSSDDEGEEVSKATRQLNFLGPQCTPFEKELFKCVVDTDNLDGSRDGIRIADDIIDSLNQLLSMRTGQSYGLLARESINGAMLYGPPGTGKTHLARVVAKSAGMNLIVATPADLETCWVGQTEQRIKALFSLGFKLAPCIVFLDEVESVFARRCSTDMAWTKKAMSQFLMEMDGLRKTTAPPFLLVATNRPADIDDAVCRRLPHMLYIGMPSVEDRRAILDIYLKEEQVADDVDLDGMAERQTVGFTGSDIRTLCIQAAMAAQRELDVARKILEGEGQEDTEVKEKAGEKDMPKRVVGKAHFTKGLSRTRPSVTIESLREIERFAQQRRRSRLR